MEELKSIQLKNVRWLEHEKELSIQLKWDQSGIWRLSNIAMFSKSDFFRIIAGIIYPVDGTVLFNELNIHQESFEKILPLRLQLGYGIDVGGLLSNRTLYENVLLPLQYHRRIRDSSLTEIDLFFKKFQIYHERHQRPAFSAGRSRKITVLIRSLILKPRFLILDDPFSGLLDNQKDQFIKLVQELFESGKLYSVIFFDSTEYYQNFKINGIIELQSDSFVFKPIDQIKKEKAS